MTDSPTILVVDDDRRIREVLTDVLHKSGYQTVVAATGSAALETFRRELVDAVLLDMLLPDIDGMEVLREIRRVGPEVPVLMVTAESKREQIIEAAKKGGKIAIVCNLVNDAQILWQRLATELHARNLSISLDIFHARFRFRDRQNIESQVLCNYGKSAAPGGRILVATQVVEQSLDLDFDWLVTQICPVDLLFQRLGRLHRHARPRPLGETTQCTVLVPDSDDYGLHAVLYGAKTERKMLLNRRVLWRTHRLLEREKKAVFPLAFRDWIKKVYQEDAWPDEPIDIQQEYQQFSEALDGKYYSGQWLAKQALNFPDDEEHAAAMTRDGEMNLMVFVFQRHHGKQCFLDGTQFDELDDWQWQEELNLNGIPVPSSWQKDLQENPDPKDTTIKRYFLEMSPVLVDQWSTSSDQYEYIYNRSMGLRRIARDGKPGG